MNLITRTKNYESNQPTKADLLFKFADNEFSIEDFEKMQLADKFCVNIHLKLNCKCKERLLKKAEKRGAPCRAVKTCRQCKKARFYKLKNGILYNTKLSKDRLVIPDKIAIEFINFLHVSHLHPGSKALEKITSRNVFIHNIQTIAKQICSRCYVCVQTKPRPAAQPKQVSLQPSATYPFEYCAIDLIDHGKTDFKGKRYLLVIVDLLSDFIDGIPLSNKTDLLVSEAL